MDHISTIYLILLLPCLLLSAFFSSSEAAFLSLRRVRIRSMVENKISGAERVAKMIEEPERVLPTILLVNNLVNTAFAALFTVILIGLIGEGRGVLFATIISTVILLILGETLPKTIGIRYPEALFFFSSRIINGIEKLLFPIALTLQGINRIVAFCLGSDHRAYFSEDEVKTAISIGRESGSVEEQEAQMLENVFRFGDRQLKEIMTPRPELVLIESGTNLKQFFEIYKRYSHSRFPVYEENPENVLGILLLKDIMGAIAQGNISNSENITTLLRPVDFVPETKTVGTLFGEMQQVGNQIAIAVDEFGGISGIVTLKQLTEEIVGPVGEDGKLPEMEYEEIDDNIFSIDGGMQIEEANEELELDLPKGDYETVAGFILDNLGKIPVEGDHFVYKDIRLVVTQLTRMKIEKVTITKNHRSPNK